MKCLYWLVRQLITERTNSFVGLDAFHFAAQCKELYLWSKPGKKNVCIPTSSLTQPLMQDSDKIVGRAKALFL
jgi:hypothetical protein